MGVEGVETDEELLTGSKDRWHFSQRTHFIRLPFSFPFGRLLLLPQKSNLLSLAGRNVLLLPSRPWPPLERQQKRSEICFSFPFFFVVFVLFFSQQLGQGRKLVGCRRWRCFACYIRRRGAG